MRAAILLGILLACSPVFADVLTVNTTKSGIDRNDPFLSFEEAVEDASDFVQDTIEFSVTGTIEVQFTVFLDKDIIINGPGADQLAISGGASRQIFFVGAFSVTISNLTLRDGRSDEPFSAGGGAIQVINGNITVNDCEFRENSATASTGSKMGGAIYSTDGMLQGIEGMATLTLNDCDLIDNRAGIFGGAIVDEGSFTATYCVFLRNKSDQAGPGAVFLNGREARIESCSFQRNSVQKPGDNSRGGAICIAEGVAPKVFNSVMLLNQATLGAAIYSMGSASVAHCSIVANLYDAFESGALHHAGATALKVRHCISVAITGRNLLFSPSPCSVPSLRIGPGWRGCSKPAFQVRRCVSD